MRPRRRDAATRQVVYRVNDEFGAETPVGFDPFQFQLQLGGTVPAVSPG